MVDPEDFKWLPRTGLARNADYAAIARKFPKVALFPGDRGDAERLTVREIAPGRREFIVDYWLLDGCHACARLGSARYGFDFAGDGKLIVVKLLGANPDPRRLRPNRYQRIPGADDQVRGNLQGKPGNRPVNR